MVIFKTLLKPRLLHYTPATRYRIFFSSYNVIGFTVQIQVFKNVFYIPPPKDFVLSGYVCLMNKNISYVSVGMVSLLRQNVD